MKEEDSNSEFMDFIARSQRVNHILARVAVAAAVGTGLRIGYDFLQGNTEDSLTKGIILGGVLAVAGISETISRRLQNTLEQNEAGLADGAEG